MSRLGIDRTTGQVYEGNEGWLYLAVPTPVVSQCKLMQIPSDFSDLPQGIGRNPFAWIFREDSFDPVSRVRRGRAYQTLGSAGWERALVGANPFAASGLASGRTDGKESKELCVYMHCSELLNKQAQGMGMRLAIGAAGSFSTWRILQTESTVGQDTLGRLHAESAFAVLPPLNETKISPKNLVPIKQAYQRALDAAYRESPTSVVDRCRNLRVVPITRWLYQLSSDSSLLGEDLARCMSAIQKNFGQGSHVLFRSSLGSRMYTERIA